TALIDLLSIFYAKDGTVICKCKVSALPPKPTSDIMHFKQAKMERRHKAEQDCKHKQQEEHAQIWLERKQDDDRQLE
ncbi:hypothetical protein C0995_011050, partial [Termitomyces sp. Mi166